MLLLTSFVIIIRFFLGQVFILLGRLLRLEFLGAKLALCGLAPFRGHCVCVYTVITNGLVLYIALVQFP